MMETEGVDLPRPWRKTVAMTRGEKLTLAVMCGLVLVCVLPATWMAGRAMWRAALGIDEQCAEPESETLATFAPTLAASHAKWLPDPTKTPGAIFKGVGIDELKKVGYTAKVRDVPLSLKKEVMARYGLPESDLSRVEIDHLISLELGGSNDVKNLWPQFYEAPGTYGARYKDILENKLHRLVVEGDVSLREAQREISTDWISAYRKYVVGE